MCISEFYAVKQLFEALRQQSSLFLCWGTGPQVTESHVAHIFGPCVDDGG